MNKLFATIRHYYRLWFKCHRCNRFHSYCPLEDLDPCDFVKKKRKRAIKLYRLGKKSGLPSEFKWLVMNETTGKGRLCLTLWSAIKYIISIW